MHFSVRYLHVVCSESLMCLQYNGVMAFVYLALSTSWILIWARDHEHTYKIHVVLGAVAVAGEVIQCSTLSHMVEYNHNDNIGSLLITPFAFSAVLGVLHELPRIS